MEKLQINYIDTDILIAGGGTAGCYGALKLAESTSKRIFIAEKANIKRSGCLAAGVNALNAYITKGRTPEFYVDYAEKDAECIVRGDLLLSMSERLNECTHDLEKLGLVILKNENGSYAERGTRNIKINGENIKPLLAAAVNKNSQITVQNHINIIDFIVKNNKVYGAAAIDMVEDKLYIIKAQVVLCATGGAAGLYRPNNPGFSRHKMWYPPFNTGAGLAAGIRSGAEMTTLEMRFIALRCKDTIAPTGTIAQGVGASQINSRGEIYENKYGLSTPNRLYGTVEENLAGRGPCYLRTKGISTEAEMDLKKAYLNMAPSQTLKWIEDGAPSQNNVEIEGTEPYIVGGHAAAGFWLSSDRQTTIDGLFAAGDVGGGCPQKYVTGAMAEAYIAANSIKSYLENKKDKLSAAEYEDIAERYVKVESKFFGNTVKIYNIESLEETMQKIMDNYAGGIKTYYKYNEQSLSIAAEKIAGVLNLSANLHAENMHELVFIHELQDRLLLCLFVIEHLRARKETRWHSFAENADYPNQSNEFNKYINSRLQDGKIKIIERDIVGREEYYEHTNR